MLRKLIIISVAFMTYSCGLDKKISSGTYKVTSDCPGATQTGTLRFDGEANISSMATIENAKDYGFPSETFSYSAGSSFKSEEGDIACEAASFEKKASSALFLCTDRGVAFCSIFFEK